MIGSQLGPEASRPPHVPAAGSPLAAAQALAGMGLPVFPCNADKSPATRHGHKDATTDPEKIERMWRNKPDSLIGMPTGAASGIMVLDLDISRQTGETAGETFALAQGWLDAESPGVRTPSGGRHVYFRHVEGVRNSAGKLAPRVDVRGEGGYVCVPGGGGYEWIGAGPWVPTGLVEPPAGLLNAILGQKAARDDQLELSADAAPRNFTDGAGSAAWAAAAFEEEVGRVASAKEGERNATLNTAAFNLGQIVATGGLMESEVRSRLQQAALGCGLEDGEALRTIASGLSAGMASPRGPAPQHPTSHGSTTQKPGPVVLSAEEDLPVTPEILFRPDEDPQPYPVDALGALAPMARAAHDIVQAPTAICGQSVLAAAALCTQGLANVETLNGTPAPLSLFLVTIAESGERKSSVDKLVMKPVRDFEEAREKENAPARQWHMNKVRLREEQRTAILAKARKNDPGAEADLEALGQDPEPPLFSTFVLSDPTLEGITRHLSSTQPSLGLFSDEGGAFLGGTGMSKDNRLKTMAGLSSFWDGAPINRSRAGDGIATWRGRRLSCHLMVQPAVAETLFGDAMANEQGFLARFLVAQPKSLIGTRKFRKRDPRSDEACEAWARQVRALLERPLPLAEGTRNELDPSVLRLTAEARELLIAFHDKVELAQGDQGELEQVRPSASKAAEQAARIAGVLTIFANADATEVDAEAMANGIQLATHALNESLRQIGKAAISRRSRLAEDVRAWLERYGEEFVCVTNIAQEGPNALRDAKVARQMLQFLETTGHVEKCKHGAVIKGKRRREVWRVNLAGGS